MPQGNLVSPQSVEANKAARLKRRVLVSCVICWVASLRPPRKELPLMVSEAPKRLQNTLLWCHLWQLMRFGAFQVRKTQSGPRRGDSAASARLRSTETECVNVALGRPDWPESNH